MMSEHFRTGLSFESKLTSFHEDRMRLILFPRLNISPDANSHFDLTEPELIEYLTNLEILESGLKLQCEDTRRLKPCFVHMNGGGHALG